MTNLLVRFLFQQQIPLRSFYLDSVINKAEQPCQSQNASLLYVNANAAFCSTLKDKLCLQRLVETKLTLWHRRWKTTTCMLACVSVLRLWRWILRDMVRRLRVAAAAQTTVPPPSGHFSSFRSSSDSSLRTVYLLHQELSPHIDLWRPSPLTDASFSNQTHVWCISSPLGHFHVLFKKHLFF